MEIAVNYNGNDVQSKVANVPNPRECMRICQYSARCRFWSFHMGTKECFFKNRDAIANRVSDTSYLSGPKYCDDMKYYGKETRGNSSIDRRRRQ